MTLFDRCTVHRDDLGAFVDGELTGAESLRVAEHLETCSGCATEAERVRQLGSLLRNAAETDSPTPEMAGLASGVVTRVNAENAQSWPAVINRGFDDWHWIIVGGGSVAATFVSMLLVTAVLLFGPSPVQQDSLAGLLSSLNTHPGTLLVEVGDTKQPQLVQVDTGAANVRVVPAMLGVDEADLVSQVMNLVVTDRGHIVAKMPAAEWRNTESLLQQIGEMRGARAPFGAASRLNVLRVRLLVNVGVSARGLWP
jgi:anti-sigma factor RsiW